MGFKCGIVGLPNVGKSTLFNALTEAGISAENYPFCTIEPNVGVVVVPDPRLDALAKIVSPQRVLPTTIKFVDIAGLVAGASKGEGLGNQFLANIRETDAIVHVVRCFESDDIAHVAGKVDPLDDIEVIHTELALADLETVERSMARVNKLAKAGQKDAKVEMALLERLKARLEEGLPVRGMTFSEKEMPLVKRLCLLTEKPTLYIANICDEQNPETDPHVGQVKEYANKEGSGVVVLSAEVEAEIMALPESERPEFLEAMNMSESGLDRVIRAGYDLLGLLTYFTAGEKEVRAWTVRKGASAPEAAGVIHTDFEKGFIRAEVTAYEDFVQYNGEQGAKEAGRFRVEGKDYIVCDGDVMHFRFNV